MQSFHDMHFISVYFQPNLQLDHPQPSEQLPKVTHEDIVTRDPPPVTNTEPDTAVLQQDLCHSHVQTTQEVSI